MYSKPKCKYCDLAKNLIEDSGDVVYTKEIGKHISRDDFINEYPDVKTVPLIFEASRFDYELIGGYEELKKHYDI